MIKNVAIYLRKSRDENDSLDVLSKHRNTLVSMCENNKWNYKLYEEIASGERIAYRPVIQELLEEIESGTYDAVLVMDIDRLGRGNNKDWGIIYESFCNHKYNTLIVTPQRTYDLTEDTDEMMVDFQSLFAKMEYKAIRKRMMRGKISGAKQGLWTCGNPPYPYVCDSRKKLISDQDKLKIYRLMISKCLSGESVEEITLFLNQNNIPSPKGSQWSSRSVTRLLTSEIHLGYMIYGKTKGDTRKNNFAKINKSDWIKVEDSHEAVKTQEEHEEILRLIASRRTIPVAARKRTHVLSGLLNCGKCGYRMQFKMSGSGYYCAICNHKFPDGTRCDCRGIKLDDDFYQIVEDAIFLLKDEDIILKKQQNYQQQVEIVNLINSNNAELNKINLALGKIFDAYESGDIDKPTFVERKSMREQQKQQLLTQIEQLKSQVKPVESVDDFIKRIKYAESIWRLAETDSEKNKIVHSVVERVDYIRNGNDIILNIYYK